MSNVMKNLMSQKAFIRSSYYMIAFSLIGMPINVGLYVSHIISESTLILVTLILSWFALTFAAYGNVIAAQVNKKVEKLNAEEVNTNEVNVKEKQ